MAKRPILFNRLSKDDVMIFLKQVRPDMSEEDWDDASLVTVLSWALPTYKAWTENGSINLADDTVVN